MLDISMFREHSDVIRADHDRRGLTHESIDEVIRLDPQEAKAYRNRGISYGRLGQHERAIQDYDEAIRLDPQDAKAYYNRGVAYQKLGQNGRGQRDINEAIRLDPSLKN